MAARHRKPWETTREPNLLRNSASGRYYGRLSQYGNQKWLNLDTDILKLTKKRLAHERTKIECGRQGVANGATMERASRHLPGACRRSYHITQGTKAVILPAIGAVLKTWPRFAGLTPDMITREAVHNYLFLLKGLLPLQVNPTASLQTLTAGLDPLSFSTHATKASSRPILDLADFRGSGPAVLGFDAVFAR